MKNILKDSGFNQFLIHVRHFEYMVMFPMIITMLIVNFL